MLEELERKEANKRKREEKKSRPEKKVLKKQLIKSNDDEVVSDLEDNNPSDVSSEPDDEMVTESIDGNFKNVFCCPAGINLHTFLATQVVSVLSMI